MPSKSSSGRRKTAEVATERREHRVRQIRHGAVHPEGTRHRQVFLLGAQHHRERERAAGRPAEHAGRYGGTDTAATASGNADREFG
jgi:hypothetical protein